MEIGNGQKQKQKLKKCVLTLTCVEKYFTTHVIGVENIRHGPKECVVVTERITVERLRDDDRPFVYFCEIKTWLVIIKQSS